MTGSGSAVFAHMLNEVDLIDAPSEFQIKGCNSLIIHPLAGWAVSDSLSVGSF
jgi:4-diphosphocytidyl-2-C-methyl-D-erythritol kinase